MVLTEFEALASWKYDKKVCEQQGCIQRVSRGMLEGSATLCVNMVPGFPARETREVASFLSCISQIIYLRQQFQLQMNEK